MKRIITAASALALSGIWGLAQAENESGFYVGAGVGQFNVKIDDISDVDEEVEKLDDEDTSWKIFAGWRFNPYIAVEGAYIDFGGAEDNFDIGGVSGNYDISLKGFAPYVIGTLPLGPVELFAKVGYYFYDVDVSTSLENLSAPDSNSSDEDLLYGAGVGMTFFEHLHARLEYEVIDTDVADTSDALWLSGAWRF